MFDIRKIQEQVIYNAVKAESNAETADMVVNHAAEPNHLWVKNTMGRLEKRFDPASIRRIRINCQCGYGIDEKLELVKEILSETSTLEEFGNHVKAREAGLSYSNGALYLQFPYCPCPMLEGVDRLETNTWCQCTIGYSKVLFEKAFGCPVYVELLKSIKMGDEICLMRIDINK